MRKIKITSLCLSAAVLLSSITFPITAHADKCLPYGKAYKSNYNSQIIDFNNSDNMKINPGKMKFMFADTDEYKDIMGWAIKSIEKLGAKGIINGYQDNCYRPKETVKNIEALSLILKLTGYKEDAEKNDKVHDSLSKYKNKWNLLWGWGYLYVAIEEGILLPEEIKGFNPYQPIKRHELAKYLVRAIGKREEAEEHMDSKLDFKDANAIPKKSLGYIYVINDLEIMTGNEKNQFKPNEPLTRAEIAVIIDRADNFVQNDSEYDNEAQVVFQSCYDNRLTVKENGKTITYKTIDSVIVYKDRDYDYIDALERGDILEIVFNDSKQVIFIEVIGEVEDKNRQDIETDSVSYNKLPAPIKDMVDVKRISKGYEAYEYGDEIYLVAYMGKKNTGGYDIEISDVEKYKFNNSYAVEATVVETEPNDDDFVTQALTYPYDVVKFESFDSISRIYFVDEDGDIIVRKTIQKLDEEFSVTGYFYKVYNDYIYIKSKASSALTKYELAGDITVYINNQEMELEDLVEGMEIELTILNDYVIEINADNDMEEKEGTIQFIDDKRNQIRLKQENRLTTYILADDLEIFIDNEEAELSDLEFGMKANLNIFNDKVIKIDAYNYEEYYEGKITNIQISRDKVISITLMVDNKKMKFSITEDTYFDMLDDESEPSDLAINGIVEIKLLNGKVTDVIEIK